MPCPCERGEYCRYCGHCVQGHWPEELPAITSKCHYPGCECARPIGEPLDAANPPLVRDPEQLERYYAACPGLREYISGYQQFIDQQALEIAALKAKP